MPFIDFDVDPSNIIVHDGTYDTTTAEIENHQSAGSIYSLFLTVERQGPTVEISNRLQPAITHYFAELKPNSAPWKPKTNIYGTNQPGVEWVDHTLIYSADSDATSDIDEADDDDQHFCKPRTEVVKADVR